MYLFEATYINIDTGDKKILAIEIDRDIFESELEAYKQAILIAYHEQTENLSLELVVLKSIGC